MLHPFQCLLGCSDENSGILLAASGSCVYSFDLLGGFLLSRWLPQQESQLQIKETLVPANELLEGHSIDENSQQSIHPPPKRQKNSPAKEDVEDTSAEKNANGSDLKSIEIQGSHSVVFKLAGPTKDRRIVAVTEDKCIRVLQLSTNGILTQLSERPMPKRPCSVVLTPDEKTILCADKFGDVYSLPLTIPFQENNASTEGSLDKSSTDGPKPPLKPFVPTANSRTVHTRRNQEALRNQQKLTNQVAKKKTLDFNHQLLLGHVSVLTDLACVTLIDSTWPPPRRRSYILTSDRDEHIRVSRGIPQTHVIEGYCLGHTEFVSKLCIPHWSQKTLISGGGDDYLLNWDWLSGTLLQKVDLKGLVDDFRKASASNKDSSVASRPPSKIGEDHQTRIAVSGIWALRKSARALEGVQGELVVTFEGIPALFIFSIGSEAEIRFRKHIPLPGNVIDVTALYNKSMIICSLDNYHIPFSTTVIESSEEQLSRPMIGCLSFDQSGHWEEVGSMKDSIACMQRIAKSQEPIGYSGLEKGKPLRDLLYGIENLRKRANEEQD